MHIVYEKEMGEKRKQKNQVWGDKILKHGMAKLYKHWKVEKYD